MAPKDKKGAQPRSAHYSSHIRVSCVRRCCCRGRVPLLLSPHRVTYASCLHSSTPATNLTTHPPLTTPQPLHAQVLNVDNATAAPSLLLFFDKERYLFNAGEGIQRHFIEYKQRMKKVRVVGSCGDGRVIQL